MLLTLNAGSTVFYGPNGGGNVGGEWAYSDNLSGAPGGADEGISSAGFSLFGNANFGVSNLQGPLAVDGMQYGLTSAGDNLTTGNAAVTGNFALIQNSVIFELSGIPGGFDPSQAGAITQLSFQYGTALSEPNFSQVPIPASLLLLGSGVLGLTGFRRKFRR